MAGVEFHACAQVAFCHHYVNSVTRQVAVAANVRLISSLKMSMELFSCYIS